MHYRGYEQVTISLGNKELDPQSDIGKSVEDIIALQLEVTLEPLYVPEGIRETLSTFLMLLLVLPGPLALLIFYLRTKCECCKKK
jgi:hypothetical protein